MENLKVIIQALEKANQAGAFSLPESADVFRAIQLLGKQLQDAEDAKIPEDAEVEVAE